MFWTSGSDLRGPVRDGRVKSKQGQISVILTEFPCVCIQYVLVCVCVGMCDFMGAVEKQYQLLSLNTAVSGSLPHTHTQSHTWTHKQRGARCIIHNSNQRQTKATVWVCEPTRTHTITLYSSKQWFLSAMQWSTEGYREREKRWLRGKMERQRIISNSPFSSILCLEALSYNFPFPFLFKK